MERADDTPDRDPHQHAGHLAGRCLGGAWGQRTRAAGLGGRRTRARGQLDFFWKHGLGYAQEMPNRPQTLYALADSPIGLAAWMLDHDARVARAFDGERGGLSRRDVVDNITLYWLPKGGHFAAWEQPEVFASELRAAFTSLRST